MPRLWGPQPPVGYSYINSDTQSPSLYLKDLGDQTPSIIASDTTPREVCTLSACSISRSPSLSLPPSLCLDLTYPSLTSATTFSCHVTKMKEPDPETMCRGKPTYLPPRFMTVSLSPQSPLHSHHLSRSTLPSNSFLKSKKGTKRSALSSLLLLSQGSDLD
jgi:hypothetical protein